MEPLDRETGYAQERFADYEKALMEEFLRFPLSTLNSLQPAEATRLRVAASLYASLRMEEMKARAHLVTALKGGNAHLGAVSSLG
jgi:hypothetical protein